MGKIYHSVIGVLLQLFISITFYVLIAKQVKITLSISDLFFFSAYVFVLFLTLRLLITVPLIWLGKIIGDKTSRFFGVISESVFLLFSLLDGALYFFKGHHIYQQVFIDYIKRPNLLNELQVDYVHYIAAFLLVLLVILFQKAVQSFFCFRVHWENAFSLGVAFLIVVNVVSFSGIIYTWKSYTDANQEKIEIFPLLTKLKNISS